MSREELTNFVIAAERSQKIKRDLIGKVHFVEIISIAKKNCSSWGRHRPGLHF